MTLAAISPPGVAWRRFVGGQQSGLAGCKPPPLFTRGASSCSSQGRLSTTECTYPPTCTLPSTGQSPAGAVHQWRAALRPVSHSDGNSDFCKDRELTEQAKEARRQQAFVNALPTGPRRATVRQLAHRVSGDVVSVRRDSCKYAGNAPDAHGLHWRSKRRQARAYMDAQCWYQGAAALMRNTLHTGCLDGRNTAMLRTLTAYYENAHPQSGLPTHVQCYQAMQAWCRAGRKKKADMPDKGTVMMPPRTEFLFHNWVPALQG